MSTTGLGFSGEVAAYYARFRPGYPPPVVDAVVRELGLTREHRVLDLGCGTGQLAAPLSRHVEHVLAVDPEPDMLAHAPKLPNVEWRVGSDADVPRLGRFDAVVVGQALHWMDHERLFREADTRKFAIIANGTPLWHQHPAIRRVLEEWFGKPMTAGCGTDADARRRYADALREAGYEPREWTVSHSHVHTIEELAGSLFSAMSPDTLPKPHERPLFQENLRAALGSDSYVEPITVTVLSTP
ncbi:class I SAM-dependent methyltransferase [Lentzea flava]|uniref:Methyltransferase n=1 Tax=Lentzea flava TaxID=103732 RepID=A0ABQ2UKJ1_9PSEU|nr:class I SAM-dependent methyltransferase [Lentzea flava]MCP2200457.1 Methyltransferase domain-containing protein [Lentzea flava]GGU42429.1 methyltransferase [Lentzea flava]